jgi:hypothetical protein
MSEDYLMQDSRKTKAQLLEELAALRSRVATLEAQLSERVELLQNSRYGIQGHRDFQPLSDALGQPHYLLGIAEEITLRKQTEQALPQAHVEREHQVDERAEALQQANAVLRVEMRDRQLAEQALRESVTSFRNLDVHFTSPMPVQRP